MSGSTSNNNIIGSGSDSIVLNMAEDQAQGEDAVFTVNVDGQQIGGPQTVTASQSAGQTEPFTFAGNFAPGQHNVTVSFVNNFIYPGLSGDRNVYVDGVTYDGQTISNTTTPIYETALFPPNSTVGNVYGNAVFSVNDSTSIPAGAPSTPTTTPAAVSIGSGSDTLVMNMAEDPYQGDAQFTVSVDGQQIGGTQTTTAVVDGGQFQEFDVHGNFGSGTHTVSVDFLNDAVGGYYPGGTPGLPAGQWALDTEDRNLYVMGMSLNGGTPVSGAPWEISSAGTENFSVTAGSNPSATAYNSGLFAADGAAATSDNAAIPSGSLSVGNSSTGSSSGMNFISSPTASTTATSTPTTADSGSTSSASTDLGSTGLGGSGSGATNTTPSVAAATSGTTQSTQDFSVPSTTGSSSSNTSSTTGGNSGNWWMTHQQTQVAGPGIHPQG
jgi:hypothetical protein